MTTPPWCREKVMVYYYYYYIESFIKIVKFGVLIFFWCQCERKYEGLRYALYLTRNLPGAAVTIVFCNIPLTY